VAVIGSSENRGTRVSQTRQLRARKRRRRRRAVVAAAPDEEGGFVLLIDDRDYHVLSQLTLWSVANGSGEVVTTVAVALLHLDIVASSTRTTPVERPFGFILVFTSDAHAHRQLLHTGYHEKV
jgi:hypothetical protein